jgi:hypothetical protein
MCRRFRGLWGAGGRAAAELSAIVRLERRTDKKLRVRDAVVAERG